MVMIAEHCTICSSPASCLNLAAVVCKACLHLIPQTFLVCNLPLHKLLAGLIALSATV